MLDLVEKCWMTPFIRIYYFLSFGPQKNKSISIISINAHYYVASYDVMLNINVVHWSPNASNSWIEFQNAPQLRLKLQPMLSWPLDNLKATERLST